MTRQLSGKDILALGFMTLALFVGAGNIIFPPMVGIQSGEHMWSAALGFLLTAVGLPVLTIVALARVGGGIEMLSAPLGKNVGLLLATICYLTVGPLFATPRTATVSFEVGIAPLTGEGPLALSLYSIGYFLMVILVAFYPGKLLDSIGLILAPVKIAALVILGGAVFFCPVHVSAPAIGLYQQAAFSTGFTQGYLTMDTLGALVFGIVIVNAARTRGVTSPALLTRYTLLAGLIAGIGLVIIYLMLFKLGAGSVAFTDQAANGAVILHAFVQHAFGAKGALFLAVLIFVACMVTAVGLTCAGAAFFARHLPLTYRQCVLILALFSMLIANAGLDHLILFSAPVLTAIYPPCIILIALSLIQKWWHQSHRVLGPTMLVSLLFGIVDAIRVSAPALLPSVLIDYLPLMKEGLVWLPPALVVLVIVLFYDYKRAARQCPASSDPEVVRSQEKKKIETAL